MHFIFQVQHQDNSLIIVLVMISQYLPLDAALLIASKGTLFSCAYHGSTSLMVVRAVDISQVVAMIPHKINGQPCYFMFKQPGQDVTNLGGFLISQEDSNENLSEDNINQSL
ncbi:hypothetical protein V8B97DRAFT_1876840 [Scleroderma yunnanense]